MLSAHSGSPHEGAASAVQAPQDPRNPDKHGAGLSSQQMLMCVFIWQNVRCPVWHWTLSAWMHLTWYMIGTETPVRSLYRAKRKQSVRACVHVSISICAVHEVNIHAYQLSASAIWIDWAFKEVLWARFKEVPGTENGTFPHFVYKSSTQVLCVF